MPEMTPDEWLIQHARATATGARIHGVEQLIGAYRMYGAVLERKPTDRKAAREFYETEATLRAGIPRRFSPAGQRNLTVPSLDHRQNLSKTSRFPLMLGGFRVMNGHAKEISRWR